MVKRSSSTKEKWQSAPCHYATAVASVRAASSLAELLVQSVGDQHVACLVGDAKRRPGRFDHRLRRDPTGPEQRHLAGSDVGLAAVLGPVDVGDADRRGISEMDRRSMQPRERRVKLE